ncbi:MAG: hypothetical protein N2037_09255 [Acidimicrobiales bacterium]|nr:hypothetical protein [Acidimicrobiales bacterium]
MKRPTKFEEFRFIGDRRTQVVYDVDNIEDESIINELLAAEWVPELGGPAYTCFAPDTLFEARNRGYQPYRGNGSGKAGVDPDGDAAA